MVRQTPSGVEMERGKLTFRTRELDLPAVAEMIGMKKSVPLKSGALSALFHVTFGKSADIPYAVDGSVSLNRLLTTLGDKTAAPANLNTAFSVSLSRESLVDAAGTLTGTVRGQNALSFGYRARISGKSGVESSASVSDVKVTQRILEAVPFRSLEQFGIRNFQFNGNAGWTKRSAGEQSVSASFVLAGLTTRKCPAPLSLQVSVETALDGKTGIEFRKFLMSASEKQDPFFDLGLSLLVLEKLQRNKRKTLVCHEHIDTTERMVQPFYFSEGLFKIGSEGQRSVYLMFVERKLSVAERIEYRKRKSIRTETDG